MKTAALLALLGLGATSIGWAATLPGTMSPASFQQVDRIRYLGRYDNFKAIDRDTLVLWTTPSRPYLIELMYGSSDLKFVQAIGVTSTTGGVRAKLDSIVIRGMRYPIKAIYEIDADKATEEQVEVEVVASEIAI